MGVRIKIWTQAVNHPAQSINYQQNSQYPGNIAGPVDQIAQQYKVNSENDQAQGPVGAEGNAAVLNAFEEFNRNKQYSQQIKPFNFLLTCHLSPIGHPLTTNPKRFHLIAPYRSDPSEWLKIDWIDQYSSARYRIKTDGHHGGRDFARVKTYDEILEEYEYHAETKCADLNGHICTQQTVGLLQRRKVNIDHIKYIGKESNSLEEVDSGTVHASEDVYTEYRDPNRDEWGAKFLPLLKKVPLTRLVKLFGMSRRALIEIRAGRRKPHPKNCELLISVSRRLELPQEC